MLDYEFLYIISIPIYIVFLIILILKKINLNKILLNSFFYFYIVSLLAITIFPIPIKGLKEIGIYGGQNNNFIPFASIIEIGTNENLSNYIKIKQILGNIVLFIPMGFFVPFIWKKYIFIKKSIFVGLISSLSIEITQYIISLILGFNYKSADIDDILLNTIGFIFGIILFRLFHNGFLNKDY
ncbi:MAG: VanZ family protein [Candidatus Gracilibacteria bacterium]|nr:VanZ family protein [Candidatus Gracilibacteria bacterium]